MKNFLNLSAFILFFLLYGETFAGSALSENWLSQQEPLLQKALQKNKVIEFQTSQPEAYEAFAARYADAIRVHRDPSLKRDGILDDPELTKITRRFGKTQIDLNALPYKSSIAKGDVTPWSSWWFPKFEDTLFQDQPGQQYSAPLTKYDYFRQVLYRKADSAAQFEKQSYDPNALTWEGLCNAWALASLLHPEPVRPVVKTISSSRFSRRNITFNVGDLKALLLKTYEGVEDRHLQYFGQKFTGGFDGWIHPDPFPDQFHRFVEKNLFEQKRSFIMDHDAGVQIWNVPVYQANYNLDPVPGNPNAVKVTMWLYSADQVFPGQLDYVGTMTVIREYHYILYGKRNSRGQLLVDSGVWIKGPDGIDSRRDHPDYFITIPQPQNVVRMSFNPSIDINIVDQLIRDSL